MGNLTPEQLERIAKTPLPDKVKTYITLRDKAAEIMKEAEEKKKQIEGMLEALEENFQLIMNEQGLENLKTPAGTVVRSLQRSATVKDGEAFFAYVLETERTDLLHKRVNSATVIAMLDEDPNSLPPGIDVFQKITISVRRAPGT